MEDLYQATLNLKSSQWKEGDPYDGNLQDYLITLVK